MHREVLWSFSTFEQLKTQSALFIKNLPLELLSESTSDTASVQPNLLFLMYSSDGRKTMWNKVL